MHELSRERTKELLEAARGKEIAVIGDVMLDRYFWGAVSRVSPEAPVPVVDVESETIHLGGAANVAANLQALGAQPVLCGVIGDDSTGKMIKMLADDAGMNTSGLVVSAQRPTTVKTRVIGNNQQIVRLDRETRTNVDGDVVDALRTLIATRPQLAGVILEDYNKGLLTEELIEAAIAAAAERGIPVFVDPKRSNFFAYRHAYVFKPNRKEATDALGYPIRTDDDVRKAGIELLERLQCENVLITLGAAGMMLFERNGAVSSVPTIAKNVADVSGAGDTAIATLAALSTAGANVREAATLANIASGIVVEEPGIVSITAERLMAAIA
ncbi:MAG: D-glycero-beta-D-manno-heptose-7-phosphate kinase [Bacteroidetes bacterium]|nr:D-glycero-beta-D-manno-heptose-7-phosphate kinase [Bacteroidota bacterium]